jgi:hypothetical protein
VRVCDCETKLYLSVFLTEKQASEFLFCDISLAKRCYIHHIWISYTQNNFKKMTRSSNVARGSLTTFSRQARATRRHLSLAPAFSHNHNLHVIYTRSYCSTSPQSGTTKPNLTLLYNEALRDIFVESSNLPAIFMIYEDMLEKGIEPNIDTFHILISTCLHTGDPATPLEFFDAIRVRGRLSLYYGSKSIFIVCTCRFANFRSTNSNTHPKHGHSGCDV